MHILEFKYLTQYKEKEEKHTGESYFDGSISSINSRHCYCTQRKQNFLAWKLLKVNAGESATQTSIQ